MKKLKSISSIAFFALIFSENAHAQVFNPLGTESAPYIGLDR